MSLVLGASVQERRDPFLPLPYDGTLEDYKNKLNVCLLFAAFGVAPVVT
jgi:hypothetical protein